MKKVMALAVVPGLLLVALAGIAYDLHVWLWRGNPDGMFAPWNPTVTCPAP